MSKPRILTERVYAEARTFIDQQGGTWLDEAIIQAVRDSKQPGDMLPPLRPHPYRGYVTDARVITIGQGPGWRVAVLFPLEDFPGAQFGHRFEPDPPAAHRDAQRLMDQIEAGAVHRMMDDQPLRDREIVWTTWGTRSTDPELEPQRAQIEAAFHDGGTPHGAGEPRVLTERDYAEARRVLDRGGWTGLDQATIDAVRDGAQPRDSLPPLQGRPLIDGVTDTEVILSGTGPGRRVAVLFSYGYLPGVRFGHRFPLEPYAEYRESIWLMEEIETGALHRMMHQNPSADNACIIWTTWGIPAQ